MSGSAYKVPPMSRAQIRSHSDAFRSTLGLSDTPFFPIMHVLEHILDNRLHLVRLEVWEDRDLGGAEGLCFKDDDGVDRIALPETVYLAGWDNEGRARFTAAHEAGHWVLHSRAVLHRTLDGQVRAFESSEWQANTFAAELLMPARMISTRDNAEDLCKRFGVSTQAAEFRIRSLIKAGGL